MLDLFNRTLASDADTIFGFAPVNAGTFHHTTDVITHYQEPNWSRRWDSNP